MSSVYVLGIDGADYRLIKMWGCENLMLDGTNRLTSIVHSHDVPATIEVWPTIATGLSPDEHGVISDPQERTEDLIYKYLIAINNILPEKLGNKVVELKQDSFGHEYPQTNESHIFQYGSVFNWPGITASKLTRRSTEMFGKLKGGEMGIETFYENTMGNTGQCIGWLASQHAAGVPISGVHIHILDYYGHIYADQPAMLRDIYNQVDNLVGLLLEQVDNLVIVSDHGMQTSVTDDPDPGVHSMEGIFSTSISDKEPPTNVLDVKSWLEKEVTVNSQLETDVEFAAPTDHLKDLGYID